MILRGETCEVGNKCWDGASEKLFREFFLNFLLSNGQYLVNGTIKYHVIEDITIKLLIVNVQRVCPV